MPVVECFALEGVTLVFFSADHRPPHFHAIRTGEWEYRVFFLERRAAMLEAKWEGKAMPGNLRRRLLDLATEHRAALLEEFERKVQCGE